MISSSSLVAELKIKPDMLDTLFILLVWLFLSLFIELYSILLLLSLFNPNRQTIGLTEKEFVKSPTSLMRAREAWPD